MKAPNRYGPVSLAGIACIMLAFSACATHAVTDPATLRIILAFKNPTDGSNATTLARLVELTGSPVRFVSAVSPSMYTYELDCSTVDPQCKDAVNKLAHDTQIDTVTVDTLRKPIH